MKITRIGFFALILSLALSLTAAAVPPGEELLASGRADEAIAALHSHLQASPDDAAAFALLLRAYYSLHRWDDAITAGQKAVALQPRNSDYHMWLARAYGEKAEHSPWFTALAFARKTRVEFETAVALNGSNVDAREDLASYYIEAPSFLGGGNDKAQVQADQVLALGAEPSALVIRSRIAESQKNYALAERELHAAIAASNGNPEPMLDLASFYRRRGRMTEMESTVNQAVQAATLKQHSNALLDAAGLLYGAGRNFSGALQMLHSFIADSSHSPDAPVYEAYYLKGAILEKLGEKPAAAEQYRAALSLASQFEPAQSALKKIEKN
ncbi:MAG: tetratricopeptide repeat protein [Terriglobales bacterium]